MSKKLLHIQSSEALTFRDGNEASFGGDVFSSGVFPPSLTTLYGAIRAIYFNEHPTDFDKRQTDEDPSLKLNLSGFCLKNGRNFLFPMPQDHVVDSSNRCHRLGLNEKDFLSSSSTTHTLRHSQNAKVQGADSFLVDSAALIHYLKGRAINTDFTPMSELVHSEAVVHNALDKYGVAKEGALFVFQQNEMNIVSEAKTAERLTYLTQSQTSFVVQLNKDFELSSKGLMTLGSDGKIANFKTDDQNNPFDLAAPTNFEAGGTLVYYLATAGIYNTGAIPDFIQEAGSGLELLTYACSRLRAIGGYNTFNPATNNGEPKPMYRTVPAGAVYYLKITDLKKAKATALVISGNAKN
jgi:CRISPR-associated protein Cmr3